jgi:hypothetical protein
VRKKSFDRGAISKKKKMDPVNKGLSELDRANKRLIDWILKTNDLNSPGHIHPSLVTLVKRHL